MARKQTLVPLNQEETGTGNQVYWKMSILQKTPCKAKTSKIPEMVVGGLPFNKKLEESVFGPNCI